MIALGFSYEVSAQVELTAADVRALLDNTRAVEFWHLRFTVYKLLAIGNAPKLSVGVTREEARLLEELASSAGLDRLREFFGVLGKSIGAEQVRLDGGGMPRDLGV